MIDSLFLAWKYLKYNKLRSATLIACITLISFLPASLNLLLDESERQLMSRAESTPLGVGAKGSALDLMMNTLYFGDEVPQIISMEAVEQVKDSDLAFPIPMYVRFKARGTPIIGTTLDYFEFRRLSIAQGRQLIMLGECVLGALAAKKLGLGPGDHLVSSPENLFDLAGVYPLKMKVTGILQVSHTPDDLAIFVDIKTAWVIQGLMHGHQDVTKTRDKSVILKKKEGNVTANAKLFQYMEITKDNIGSFHFHGDPAGYPLTALVAVPYDEKSGTILRGRYLLEDTKKYQIVKPRDVIEGLLQNIFRIKNVLDAVILIVGCATILAIILVFALSLRLREQEIQTIFKLGCGRLTIARLLGAEIFIIVAASSFFCAIFVTIINLFSNDLVRMMFIQ
jgi:putative ABC transport system permease protein